MTEFNSKFKRNICILFALLIFIALATGFYRLQISNASLYSEKSLRNSVRVVTQIPVRGNIYDRSGKLIVGNRPAFSLYMVRNSVTDTTIKIIAHKCNIDEADIRKALKKVGRFQPAKIMRQLNPETFAWIEENLLELPGVELKYEPKRFYTRASGLAHLLGTLGEVTERELKQNNEFESGDIVGKKAIEKSFDASLRGKKGVKFMKVDALGRKVDDLPQKADNLPDPGEHLYLTIDLRLQSFADSIMAGKRGALVAMDTRNGEVLALVSKPDYDLKHFTGSIPADIWNQLLTDPHHPLFDRACQSGYPPGSIYKMVAAIAALNEKIVTSKWEVNCPGYFKLGRRTIRCWNPEGHGEQNLKQAIRNSCNVYFYKLGLLIGVDLWSKYSSGFHFGERTGIELTTENSGLVPSRNYYNERYGKNGWGQGMIANLAIGQGELLVTPLQMVQFVTTLANRGKMIRPHLGYKIHHPLKDEWREISMKTGASPEIDSTVYDLVLEGMRQVVDGGTGWRAAVYGIPGAGKTGTAQNPHGKSHAWFLGFSPFDNPEIAICVLVENGGSGGGIAAPIAGKFLKQYYYLQGRYDYAIEAVLRAQAAKRDSIRKANADTLVYDIISETE